MPLLLPLGTGRVDRAEGFYMLCQEDLTATVGSILESSRAFHWTFGHRQLRWEVAELELPN